MFPKKLVNQYWIRVHKLLQNEFKIAREQALAGIADYRRALEIHGAHEIVYHSNEPDVAKTVAGLINRGQWNWHDNATL
jgi:hypothetical protein